MSMTNSAEVWVGVPLDKVKFKEGLFEGQPSEEDFEDKWDYVQEFEGYIKGLSNSHSYDLCEADNQIVGIQLIETEDNPLSVELLKLSEDEKEVIFCLHNIFDKSVHELIKTYLVPVSF